MDREAPIHRAVLERLTEALPGALIHHSPNSWPQTGTAAARAQAKHRWLGTRAGFPDLVAVWKGQLLAFEVKAPGGRVSPEQAEIGQRIEDNGGRWAVVKSPEDALAALERWRLIGAQPQPCPQPSFTESRETR